MVGTSCTVACERGFECVPGHDDAQCYVTNGDSDKLVEDMMELLLITFSEAAYESLLPSYKDVLDCIK